jgi:glycosyltransferase involved in cell wall biosynthesis
MRILHVFRTPVGGLFRHVRDLARGQQARGHQVAMLCDSTTGGETAALLLRSAEPHCEFGVKRIPISRLPGLGDLWGAQAVARHARAIQPDIIHCHGAKGGLYARLAARRLGIASIYTPHGGSLHYKWNTLAGATFLAAERVLSHFGSGMLFVCRYERETFASKIGLGGKPHAIVYNGLWPEEFVQLPVNGDAADIVFIGDMRMLKGVDVLIEALAQCNRQRRTTALLAGDGPDLERFKAQAKVKGLADAVTFPGRMALTQALPQGRLLVMPSRSESFPYVVLEACAAGKPLIASEVGGIPEILEKTQLVPPNDAAALAERIVSILANPVELAQNAVAARETIRQRFTADAMVDGVVSFYRQVLAQDPRRNLPLTSH